MSAILPRVTVMIATKDRREPLRLTLSEMRKQRYPSMELLVIDDGSSPPVEPLVKEIWPEATVITHGASAGQCARRNEGFDLATGDYILQLDDDCSFTGPGDLAHAIALMEKTPSAGAFSFYVVNSAELPPNIDTSRLNSGCVASFVGAAVLFRKSALRQTVGYRAFFGNDWEEEELGLQLLDGGWRIVFIPEIVAHHRLSSLNRNSGRTWMRGLRNRLWSILIHMPAKRAPLEFAWKVSMGAWDAIRLMRYRLFFQALTETAAGLPRAWGLRKPLSNLGARRYNALRLNPVLSPEHFENPPAVTGKVLKGFWDRWRNRARNRSVWDAEKSDTGSSYTVAYAHEDRPNESPVEAVKK